MAAILGMMEWETRVADTYSMIESCRMNSADTLAYIRKWIDAELTRKHGSRAVYSQYLQGFVRGMCRARDNRIMRDLVEFCYVENGVLFSTHRESAHRKTEEFYSAGRGCELAGMPSGFFWKGTDKPYFVTGETTAFRGWADKKASV
jgi:hypothetical protein